MMLRTWRIIDLLRNKRGRYIHHDAGAFRMKEANGEDVMLTEDRRGYLVEPTAQQIDDLMDAKRLVRDGSKYVLPPGRARRPPAS
jgi:hypothetical protein